MRHVNPTERWWGSRYGVGQGLQDEDSVRPNIGPRGGMILPGFRVPGIQPDGDTVGQHPPTDLGAVPSPRTFQPPTAPQDDPRIKQLTDVLSQPQQRPTLARDPQMDELINRLKQPVPQQDIAEDPRIAGLIQDLNRPWATMAEDPRLAQLAEQIRQQIGIAGEKRRLALSSLGDISGPETPESIRRRIEAAMAGAGQNIATDQEAAAYRVAALREEERARAAEANRLGASGMTGGGEFEAALAGLREATGQRISGYEAGLAGRRRREALETATGAEALAAQEREGVRGARMRRAQIELESAGAELPGLHGLYSVLANQRQAELERMMQAESQTRASKRELLGMLRGERQNALTRLMQGAGEERASQRDLLAMFGGERQSELDRLMRAETENRGSQQALLNQLLAQQARQREEYGREMERGPMRLLEEELMQQRLDEGAKRLEMMGAPPRGLRTGPVDVQQYYRRLMQQPRVFGRAG